MWPVPYTENIPFQRSTAWAGRRLRAGKAVGNKLEDPRSMPRTLIEIPNMAVPTCDCRAGQEDTGRSLGLLFDQSRQIRELQGKVREPIWKPRWHLRHDR